MQIKELFTKSFLKQFLSYFCVGGVAAIVEWVLFTVFANVLGIQYIVATCLAFVFSTATNWILGRIWTFKNNRSYQGKRVQEIILVFVVSAIGLLFNMGLMYVFVTLLKLDTPLLKTISKIVATGIVFIWNFAIRKFVIYR